MTFEQKKARAIALMDSKKMWRSNYARKRKLTAVCSHQTRIGNLDAHLI